MDRSISSGPEAERSSGTAARFRIQAMDCAAEESEIRRALEPVAGIVSLSFQLGARTLAISAPQPVIAEALAAIRRAGFDPQPLAPSAQDGNRTADPHDIEGMLDGLRRPVIALLLAAGAEGLAYFGGADLAVTGIEMALAAAAIWLAGFETYRKGFSALRHGRLNITALMSVAVTGAFLIGQWPEAAMVMALYAIAELIEARSLDRARNAIQSLLALAPQQAQLRQADGTWQTVPAADVPVDAIVRIRPGERVPLDGVVTAGAGAIDQAPVTGESIPVDKTIGDGVFAGTINQAAELEIRTTAAADDSTLARIIHAVEQAQGSRAPTQRFVDRFAAVYTPGVFALAVAVTLLSPWLMDWTWAQAAYKALVLLVIACPCALVISTPVTVVSALASAARRGILIKGGVYLEDARKLKAIAFDKTGTITEGKPRLVESVAIDGGDGAAHLALAASLAGRSDHPVSRAIAEGLRLGGVAVGDFSGPARSRRAGHGGRGGFPARQSPPDRGSRAVQPGAGSAPGGTRKPGPHGDLAGLAVSRVGAVRGRRHDQGQLARRRGRAEGPRRHAGAAQRRQRGHGAHHRAACRHPGCARRSAAAGQDGRHRCPAPALRRDCHDR